MSDSSVSSTTPSISTTPISSSSTISQPVTTSQVVTTSIPPSTTFVAPTTTPPSSSSVVVVSSTVPVTPSNTPNTQGPSIVTITSTRTQPTVETPTFSNPTTSSSSSATPTPSQLAASDSGNGSSGGLSQGATIAIAVIIPIVAIAALILFGLWFWRRRKAKKVAEEERKNEMAEYGFNPNNDPTLAPAAAYAEDGSDDNAENSGYRGWGATSSNRKASTTLGSASRPQGLAVSDNGSQPSGYPQSSPNAHSDAYSNDPLMRGHPESGDGVGALGAAATGAAAAGGLARHRSGHKDNDIRRGPSNASSAYSNGKALSEASSDRPDLPNNQYYQEEVPYNIYNDAQPGHGPYGDGSYGGNMQGGGQPVIRDVQARRNTRIERAPTMPQQGGIAQNF